MRLINNTSISNELIKSISLDVGLDLNKCNLEINYSTSFNGKVSDDTQGQCYASSEYGLLTIHISLLPWAKTSTLAHELRHGMQFQTLGIVMFDEMYEIETEFEGYDNNIFEVDARDAGNRWTF